MKYNAYQERNNYLLEISKLDFALGDLALYLDTHPYDSMALEQWNCYQRMKQQLEKEYNQKYPPIKMDDIDETCKEWTWALQEPPWKRGY